MAAWDGEGRFIRVCKCVLLVSSSDSLLSGIRAGMWAGEAFQLCPDLVVMPYEFDSIMETAELFYRSVLDTTPYVQGAGEAPAQT